MSLLRIHPVLLCLVVFSISCGDAEETSPAPKPAPKFFEATTSQGSYAVRIDPLPAPIPLNELFSLNVAIEPQGDVESPDAVVVDADMPEHKHGMNTKPVGTRKDESTWTIEGMLFHMPGAWELYVDVDAGGIVERAVIPIEMSTP